MSNTAYKIKVMQAFEDGEEIEYFQEGSVWQIATTPSWDWLRKSYRIKSQPKDIWVNEFKEGLRDEVYCTKEAAEAGGKTYTGSIILRTAVHYREIIE